MLSSRQRISVGFHSEVKHATGRKAAVVGNHLATGQFLLREAVQARIAHGGDLGVSGQEMGHPHRRLLLVHHPSGQGRQTVNQDGPGRPRRKGVAEILAEQHQVMVVAVGAHHDAAHIRPEAADVLGQAVDNQVGSMFQRPLAERRGEGVVHDDPDLLALRAPGVKLVYLGTHGPDVNQVHCRVYRRFEIHHAGLRRGAAGDVARTQQVAKARSYAEAGQPVGHETVGAAIDGLVGQNFGSVRHTHAQRSADRRHP